MSAANLISAVTIFSTAQYTDLELIDKCTSAAAANLVFALAIRQEPVINTFFAACWSVPKSTPLWLRTRLAHVYEFGGMHSGAATCALVWFLLLSGYITKAFVGGALRSIPLLTLDYALLCLLAAIVLSAVPAWRMVHHNSFERLHRFAGWSVLALFWTLLLLFLFQVSEQKAKPAGLLLIETPAFWLALVASALTILPWLRLRRVAVRAERLSTHAIRLHLAERVPALQGVALSDAPMSEWHAFASFPDDGENAGTSVLISHAGDWTRKTIAQPRPYYYIKGWPRTGVLAMAKLFRRIVFVATGSGIGPLLAVALNLHRTRCRVVWSTRSPVATYGEEICGLVRRTDPDALVIDTDGAGRPNLVELAWKLHQESGSEAVFVVSNKKVTRMVLPALRGRGVPSYAPIFDS